MTDLIEALHAELERDQRPNDGLLHASSHFIGSLRHVQLEVAGAPTIRESFARQMPLYLGQAMHDLVHRALRGEPAMVEVDVTPWMPAGWGGTADRVTFLPATGTYRLTDYKSQKGAGMRYILEDGAKDEHQAQASLYWHALVKMGLPMEPEIDVVYLPKDEGREVEPLTVTFKPLPRRALHAEAAFRRRAVEIYMDSLNITAPGNPLWPIDFWLTDELEPVQEREQKLTYDKATETWDLKLVPHWSAAYCPFPDELCDCSAHGHTKIGMFDVDGQTYYARSGYEDIEPTVFPS
jgi:hypothetical protein